MSRFPNFPNAVPDLFGESVCLRELIEDDIPAWFGRATDEEAADLAGDPVPGSIDMGMQWLQRHRDRFRDGTAVRWAIVPTGSAVSVGTVGLSLKPGDEWKAELGIVVARALWSKGIGTAAANLANHYAFTTLGVSEIHAEVLRRNPGSIRLLEKAGFQFLRGVPATAAEPEELLRYSLSRPCPVPPNKKGLARLFEPRRSSFQSSRTGIFQPLPVKQTIRSFRSIGPISFPMAHTWRHICSKNSMSPILSQCEIHHERLRSGVIWCALPIRELPYRFLPLLRSSRRWLILGVARLVKSSLLYRRRDAVRPHKRDRDAHSANENT